LELELRLERGRTVLSLNHHQGPLVVQRPFYPQGERGCHLYVLHPPGGVVAGDRLKIDVRVGAGATALITTPAAGKIYRSEGPRSLVGQTLVVEPGAALEWLPGETIIYDQASARLATRVELAAGAAFVGWEIICLGLPASGQPFRSGRVWQDLEVWRAGEPLLLERGRYEGGSPALEAAWGLGGCPVSGVMMATQGSADLVAAVRDAVGKPEPPGRFAVTSVSGLLVCRYLGEQVEGARRCFSGAWEALRPHVMGQVACPPRIWRH
jgi:urease accessory protein